MADMNAASTSPQRRSKKLRHVVSQLAFGLNATGRRLQPTGNIRAVRFVPAEKRAFNVNTTWSALVPKFAPENGMPHPTPLLQPSLHACISPPSPKVPVRLDSGMVEQGILSSEQIEIIGRNLNAHESISHDQDGRAIRLAHANVFGTGTGKTSIALGVIEATRNLTAPNHPAVIVTINNLVQNVFVEQTEELGIAPNTMQILKHANIAMLEKLDLNAHPTLLVTYAILRRPIKMTVYEALAACDAHPTAAWEPLFREIAEKRHAEREQFVSVPFIDLLIRLLPGDAIWVWDECDGLRNKHSDQHRAYRNIDKAHPFARMVFLSATATPNPAAIGYLANRLGIAGQTALYETADAAVAAATADLTLAEIMVAHAVGLGTLSTGGLSYEGIVYDTVVSETTSEQRVLVDACNDALTTVVNYGKERIKRYDKLEFDSADFHVPTPGELTTLARLAQRTLVMDLCRDALFARIDESLEAGKQIVIELAHTGEAQRKDAAFNEETHVGTSGRQIVARLLRKAALPLHVRVIQRGDKKVLVDRDPALTARHAGFFTRMFDAIVEQDHVLTALADRYGDAFGEITGRAVRTTRVGGQFQVVRRSAKRDNAKAVVDFNSGRIRIVAISEAGSRGIDLHSASHFECTARRVLMVFDPFLRPAEFAQALGRVCRTGQISWPEVLFFSTDIPALSAALSAILSKVKAAGACTYGDRRAIRVQTSSADLHGKRGAYAISKALEELGAVPEFLQIRETWTVSATSSSFLLAAARLPCNDRHPDQQKLWSVLARHYGEISVQDPQEGILHVGAEKIDIRPAKLGHIDAMLLTTTQAGSDTEFVRTWQTIEKREEFRDIVFTMTNGFVHAYCPLPSFGSSMFPEFLHYTPLHSNLHTGDPAGYVITAEEAKRHWNTEIGNMPKSTRTALVVPFPIADIVHLDRQTAKLTKEKPLLTDEALARNCNVFYDATGQVIFGLWLSSHTAKILNGRYQAAGLDVLAGTAAA